MDEEEEEKKIETIIAKERKPISHEIGKSWEQQLVLDIQQQHLRLGEKN